jgi:hypothetical protein
MTYTPILASETDPDSPYTSSLAKRYAGNPVAMFAADAGAPKLVDAALDATATAAGATWVGARMALISSLGVGCFALLQNNSIFPATITPGVTVAGSSFTAASVNGTGGSPLTGTWMCCGYCQTAGTATIPATDSRRTTIWQRIA